MVSSGFRIRPSDFPGRPSELPRPQGLGAKLLGGWTRLGHLDPPLAA